MSAPLPAAPAVAAPRARWMARATGVGLAVLGVLLTWVLVDPILGVDLSVTESGTTTVVGPGVIIGLALGAALLGWAFLAVLERFVAARARLIWTAVAVAVLAISCVAPFTSGEMDTSARWSLLAMHLVVGAAVIPLFARRTGDSA